MEAKAGASRSRSGFPRCSGWRPLPERRSTEASCLPPAAYLPMARTFASGLRKINWPSAHAACSAPNDDTMSHVVSDIRSGVRLLFKYPTLSLVAVLTLGLGIGLATTVFCVVNGGLFQGLPFPDADRIVAV